MSLTALLADPLWDAPFFKQLAPNDTGQAAGHQGGMVIPKDLRMFFPGLAGATSAATPTLDHRINALLYVDGKLVGSVVTRYQIQTWGGGRSPESRLTDQLGPLRNQASGGDFLIMQRRFDDLDQYRLLLVTKKSPEHANILQASNGKKWGLLTAVKPLSNDELVDAEQQEVAKERAPFSILDQGAQKIESRSMKMARSITFRKAVLSLYSSKCCVCGEGMATPEGGTEVQAAHIVPRSVQGPDDARNGLCLCTRHHWAFDNGLFGIDANRTIVVPFLVRKIPENHPIAIFDGKPITEAGDKSLKAAQQALDWHAENILRH